MKFIDLTGKKIGKLTVLNQEEDYIQTSGRHRSRWKCICECGNECIVDGDALRTGNTKSCGCLKHRKLAKDLTGQRFGKLVVRQNILIKKFIGIANVIVVMKLMLQALCWLMDGQRLVDALMLHKVALVNQDFMKYGLL